VEPTDENLRAFEEAHRPVERGETSLPPQVRQSLADLSGKRVLHIGAGSGAATVEFVELGASVTGVDPSDGALEVIAIEAGPRLGLIGLAYRLRSGTLTSHPRAYHAHGDQIEVQVPDGTCFNIDGELVNEGDARFTAVKHAFRLVVG